VEQALEKMATDVLDAAFVIHTDLGPGLLERVYQRLLVSKLKRTGYSVESEVPVTFSYEGETFQDAFRIDVLVEKQLIWNSNPWRSCLPCLGNKC
jgi:iron complex transport system substrate-binding protein